MIITFATCHTDGCQNSGISIELHDAADLIVCGPCGQEITDKVNA